MICCIPLPFDVSKDTFRRAKPRIASSKLIRLISALVLFQKRGSNNIPNSTILQCARIANAQIPTLATLSIMSGRQSERGHGRGRGDRGLAHRGRGRGSGDSQFQAPHPYPQSYRGGRGGQDVGGRGGFGRGRGTPDEVESFS